MTRRTKSSQRWLKEHFADPYVRQSQQQGYRSRAVYKLLEIDAKYQLLKPGRVVVDLGAAPGGWSQVAAEKLNGRGSVIASDILPMDSIVGVDFIQGDFTEDAVYQELLERIGPEGADLVISDMAPNLSGVKDVDQPRTMLLVELALDLAERVLKPGGDFIAKIFHGEGFDDFMRTCRSRFGKVKTHKPDSSRSRSPEVYLVAQGLIKRD